MAPDPSVSALTGKAGAAGPPTSAAAAVTGTGDAGEPDAGGRGEEGQSRGWGDAICQGHRSGRDQPTVAQLIVEAAGGRRAICALLREILPFSSLLWSSAPPQRPGCPAQGTAWLEPELLRERRVDELKPHS